jgi:hypothetical protein
MESNRLYTLFNKLGVLITIMNFYDNLDIGLLNFSLLSKNMHLKITENKEMFIRNNPQKRKLVITATSINLTTKKLTSILKLATYFQIVINDKKHFEVEKTALRIEKASEDFDDS